MKTVEIQKYFNSSASGKWHFFDIVDDQGEIYYVNFTPKSPFREKGTTWLLQGNEKEFYSLQELVENTILPKETESLIKNRLVKEIL